jgi:uncharacterized membrane protein (DUF441 family)
MSKLTAFWIQFITTVLGTMGATYISSEENLIAAIVGGLGAASAMVQKSAGDPRRTPQPPTG